MADKKKFTDAALMLGVNNIPYVPGSISITNDLVEEFLQSGGKLSPDIKVVYQKKPSIKAQIFDISLISGLTPVGTGNTYVNIGAYFRAYECNGNLGVGYRSLVGTQGVLLPVSLQASIKQKATLDIISYLTYSNGSAYTFGNEIQLPAVVDKAFVPDTIVIGSDTIDLESVNLNFDYGEAMSEGKLEPTCYHFETKNITGSATIFDLAMIDSGRFDSMEDTVVVNFIDRVSGDSFQINLGTCSIKADIQDKKVNLSFTSLRAA